jgi:hypothetical protein
LFDTARVQYLKETYNPLEDSPTEETHHHIHVHANTGKFDNLLVKSEDG